MVSRSIALSTLASLSLLTCSQQTAAQSTAPRPASSQPAAALPTADRLAAAAQVVDKLWPLGTYRMTLQGQVMPELTNAVIDPTLNVRPEDFMSEKDIPEGAQGLTMADMIAEEDPQFRERLRIINEVMHRETLPFMDRAEPSIRSALTIFYARQFTVQQLHEVDRFLTTPAGRIFAKNWVHSIYDDDVSKAMTSYYPEVMKAMDTIVEKTNAATAHLPVPRSPAAEVASKEVDGEAAKAAISALREAEFAAAGAEKWSESDRRAFDQLRDKRDALSVEWERSDARTDLFALDAKERSGEKLNQDEIFQRDRLRDIVKDKK